MGSPSVLCNDARADWELEGNAAYGERIAGEVDLNGVSFQVVG